MEILKNRMSGNGHDKGGLSVKNERPAASLSRRKSLLEAKAENYVSCRSLCQDGILRRTGCLMSGSNWQATCRPRPDQLRSAFNQLSVPLVRGHQISSAAYAGGVWGAVPAGFVITSSIAAHEI